MSGNIARTRADEILERGIEQGIEQGEKKGRQEAAELMNFLWSSGRGEEAKQASGDRTVFNRLLDEYRGGVPAGQ